MRAKSISVVLPSYNERDNIAEAIRRISASVGSALQEVIVVDDNSPDRTWEVVQGLKNKKVRLLRRMTEKGLASALADGVALARGNIIVWMDCDLGLPPEDVPRLISQLDYYDVAIGSRYAPGGKDLQSRFRVLGSLLLNGFAQLLLGRTVRDYTSGFVAVRREVLERIHWSRKGFGEYFIEFAYRCQRNRFKVVEVGYVYKDRQAGTSKAGGNLFTLLKYGVQYGLKIIEVRLRG
jgi:dolichol-phosphate mannosyltransferase